VAKANEIHGRRKTNKTALNERISAITSLTFPNTAAADSRGPSAACARSPCRPMSAIKTQPTSHPPTPTMKSIIIGLSSLLALVSAQEVQTAAAETQWMCISSCFNRGNSVFVRLTAAGQVQCAGASQTSCRWFQGDSCAVPGKGTVAPPADFGTGFTCKSDGEWWYVSCFFLVLWFRN